MKYNFNCKIDYDSKMDTSCISLCNILNSLPGIETKESCCGHGKSPYNIWFKVYGERSMQGLFFLTRCVDRRYWKYGNTWSISLSVGDRTDDGLPIIFLLSSNKKLNPEEMEDQVKSLEDNLNRHLNHINFKQAFKIDLSLFKVAHA